MSVLVTVHCLLLAWPCLWVHSTPVPLLHQRGSSSEDSACSGPCITAVTGTSTHTVYLEPSGAGKSTDMTRESTGWTDLSENVETGGGAGPEGRGTTPEGIVRQAGNEDIRGGGSGPSGAGKKAGNRQRDTETAAIGSSREWDESQKDSTADRAGQGGDIMEDILASKSDSSVVSPEPVGQEQKELAGERKDPALENGSYVLGGVEWGSQQSLASLRPALRGQKTETTSAEPLLNGRGVSPTGFLFSPISPSVHSPPTSIPESLWTLQEEVTISALQDPLLPDLGPALASKQEGLESLWTEPLRQSGEHTVGPLSQDVATEGTMSSEDLPLIFEPFDDVTPEGVLAGATLAPGSSQPPVAMATKGTMLSEAELDQVVTVDAAGEKDASSHVPLLLLPDWTSPWQTSGAEISEPISPLGQFVGPSPSETEMPDGQLETAGDETLRGPEDTQPTSGPSPFQTPMATVTMATTQPAPRLRSGLEELESEEEPEEDEEDENTDDSEEDSEEDLTGAPRPAPTNPPYSLIPPPRVWVQRNPGQIRSWVEQIREKAGYVSGMLAPVGIGIAGALLIVGALYSARVIHRRRRNSFKHQRRKVRQTEQPREPGSNRQDQAMLLADSSEDEF